jgi:uncharacterized protein
MFIDFFFALRRAGIAVSITEWLTLMAALSSGLGASSMMGFYTICRATCVKSESLYDAYDRCFAEYFHGLEIPEGLEQKVLDWLSDPKISERLAQMVPGQEPWDLERLRREFEQRLREQSERHDGGSHWVGTGGTSAFGHSGFHPGGIRVGGAGQGNSAAQVASQRRFRDLRRDQILDTRSLGMALKQLRILGRQGQADELDLGQTIRDTAAAAGEIEVVMRPRRRNELKLLLLLDVGGSMTPFTRLSEQLFTAMHQSNHFRALRTYYFHNCPYDYLFSSMTTGGAVLTKDVLQEIDASWNLFMVGDAAMHPYELTAVGGAIDYFFHNEQPGTWWLHHLRQRVPKSVWLNPREEAAWDIPSIQVVKDIFPDMFPLSVAGLEAASRFLNRLNQKENARC